MLFKEWLVIIDQVINIFFTFIGVILSFCVSIFVCFGIYIYFKYFYLRKIWIAKIDKEKIKECIIILLVVIAFFSAVLIPVSYTHLDVYKRQGGPPCPGFSNAKRQKNHLISMNNVLVKEYFRAIK